jgi:hypothetical protein
MAHHVEKKESIVNLYYLVGLLGGLFVGFILDMGLHIIVIGGIVGFLFAVFFYNVLVKGRADS